MSDLPSFVVREEKRGIYSVKVNGKEIGDYVSSISVKLDAGDTMKVYFEVPASSFEAYCDLKLDAGFD